MFEFLHRPISRLLFFFLDSSELKVPNQFRPARIKKKLLKISEGPIENHRYSCIDLGIHVSEPIISGAKVWALISWGGTLEFLEFGSWIWDCVWKYLLWTGIWVLDPGKNILDLEPLGFIILAMRLLYWRCVSHKLINLCRVQDYHSW